MFEQSAREAIATVSTALWERGWVANHDGNVTVRLEDGRILATPTAVSKRLIRPDDVIVLSPEGKLLEGQRLGGKPFSELHLHLRAFAERPDVKVVVHAHPPTATGFAVAGLALTTPVIAEAVVSLGAGAPLVPYAKPGSREAEDGLAEALRVADAALLANHGVLTVGADVEQAFLRMELVEHLAKIQLVARQIGRVNALPADETAALLEKNASLFPKPGGRSAASKKQEAPAPPERSPAGESAPPACGDGPGSITLPPLAASGSFPTVLDPSAIERAVRDELEKLGLARR